MKTVLVIDDSEELRETVKEILADAGYGVKMAGSVSEARGVCEESRPDLVICDLVLPIDDSDTDGEDGMESAMAGVSAIAELSKMHDGLPVIAISGELVGAPLETMTQFGAVKALSKPFSRDDLLSAVEQSLR